ncbi:hypothetical protein [Absidia glauca]|uniref:phospholipase D n=1 Tax=Absidia glauca TaxID=4829 RepID=A0A168QEL7_ABSGL|nr:hypothetical protein [Absidia glauca]
MAFFTNLFKQVSELFDGDDDEEKREEQLNTESHRYESFAPVRHGAQVKHYVDGQDYCWAVSEAIENAQEVVFIEDWWLTPELYLRRPCAKYPEYRLDALLQRKAEQGVKIYIVVYKEVKLALTLDSRHTKETLQALHENIIVQRHPNHDVGGTFFWSHHEKFVVVDNKIAFLGGIDLCFGRWDTHAHRLADFVEEDPLHEVYPGQDYSDARVRDFEEGKTVSLSYDDHLFIYLSLCVSIVKNWDMRLIDKTAIPRMPWHDMSLCMMGGPVLDVARHFCERWNFVKNEKAKDIEAIPFLQPPLGGFVGNTQRFNLPNEEEQPAWQRRRYRHGTRGVTGTCRAQVVRSSADWSLGIKTEHSIQNAYIEAILGAQHFIHIENQFFITATVEDKDYILKNQIGAAIVKRIVRAHEEQEKFKVFVLMPLMPAFPADLSTKDAATARLVMHYQYISICRGGKSIIEQLEASNINASDYIRFYSLRSHDRIKRSVVEDVLTKVEGYTYDEDVEDEVEDTAVGESEEHDHSHSHSHANRRYHKCREPWVAHDFVSEELYIHAKLLIADDRLVIMGSSNLNDRSQCGDRDSEIALVVEDKDMVPSQINGKDYEVSRFATQLRRKLWKEHLGLLKDKPSDKVNNDMLPLPIPQLDTLQSRADKLVQDPLNDETLELWQSTSTKNTEAFRHVFHCVPDDNVTTWEEYHAFYPDPEKTEIGHVYDPEMPVDEIVDTLSTVRGHLVDFPLKFLEQVDLQGESVPFLGDDINELYT